MKRLVAVCMLILCLSFPVLAGHTTPGYGWCECDNPAGHTLNRVVRDDSQESTPDSDLTLGLVLVVVLLYLRTKA